MRRIQDTGAAQIQAASNMSFYRAGPEMLEALLTHKFVLTLATIVTILLLRWLLAAAIARSNWAKADKRRRISTVHNYSNLLLVIGLIAIWITELREFALSIAAFSVAIVLALREFVQCFVGGVFQRSMRAFNVGDWIKIGDKFGEVIDSDWLSTTLLEIDPHGLGNGYTGATLFIPNSAFFTQPVKNLNFMRRYIEHSFALVRESNGVNPMAAKEYISTRIREHCEPFREVAERYCKLIEHRMGVELSGPDAEVRITTNELGHDVLTVTVFCPREEAHEIEQKVTEDFFNFWHQQFEATSRGGANTSASGA
ncbi:mechanosensitive ion channel family protein [Microbulbifer thermotolerans]|uniref:Mechanosensitive ion channel family protein n=2 Tax=Microbulbifer thermotolerans TaxID=252514 RepID=A0AB35HWA1_MICTH|nr:mechanosensitive ion channel domain-containing protein [Microbulbifer thermotolerans]MCX2779711.1 mechanosensitive ion channel family protein [Microbulbifer thermotolerans]MCX2782357.1 mechanosensitive ion channel family protein [Microbulbifer thermotolerans]MCX2794946.1 mechanosensitive ion channel family protein [Microbulbifer thermotolerans]MCX2800510.1 mechanosensitive ion channel family protein [Microbulbifer thermotolerans]MCX2805118.1 mechanosensitive ion channel family protein [Micr